MILINSENGSFFLGLELLYQTIQTEIEAPKDLFVGFIHFCLLKTGFLAICENTYTTTELLPHNWQKNSRILYEKEGERFELRHRQDGGERMHSFDDFESPIEGKNHDLIIRLKRVTEDWEVTLAIEDLLEFVNEKSYDKGFSEGIKNLQYCFTVIYEGLIYPLRLYTLRMEDDEDLKVNEDQTVDLGSYIGPNIESDEEDSPIPPEVEESDFPHVLLRSQGDEEEYRYGVMQPEFPYPNNLN